MELKKFRNKYDLELIPASHENIILGNLVYDPLIGEPKFEHRGMPENIFNSFIDAELLEEAEWKKFLRSSKREKIVDAHMAESTLNIDLSVATSLGYPTIGEIDHNFGLKKVNKFTFGDLQVRTMSNLSRIRIDSYLEILKKNKWDAYDGNIRRVFMITELYYGSIKLITNTEWKSDLDAKISKLDNLKLKNTIELGKSLEYTFDHQNVPFAMRIEKVREFNG
jgi:hypothetical protein